MRIIGKIKEVHRVDDEMVVSFAFDGDYKDRLELEAFADNLAVLQISKYEPKYSDQARKYFWELVDQLSRAIGNDQQSTYQWLLTLAGVFDYRIEKVSDFLNEDKKYKVVEVIRSWVDEEEGEYIPMIEAKCYLGMSQFNKKQLSHLIEITQAEAKDQGIDIWTEDELRRAFGDKENR